MVRRVLASRRDVFRTTRSRVSGGGERTFDVVHEAPIEDSLRVTLPAASPLTPGAGCGQLWKAPRNAVAARKVVDKSMFAAASGRLW